MATSNITPFKKILFANIENAIFTVSTSITSIVLVICSIYTFFLLLSGGFMTCAIPGESRDDKTEVLNHKFCFNARSSTFNHFKSDDPKEVVKNNVYVWTPYILIVQAILFYLPKYISKHVERDIFEMAMVSFVNLKTSTSGYKRKVNLARAYNEFLDRLLARRYFALGAVFCEIINVVALTSHIYAMKVYLGTKFYEGEYSGNSLDVLFPKSLQCAHRYHGVVRNGTIGNNVVTCDMPINYANEIIYTYLWICSNLLLGLATLVILHRLLSMHLYCRSNAYNRFEFERVSCCPMKEGSLMVVAIWGYPRWLTLRRLAGELNGEAFSQLIVILEQDVDFEPEYEVSNVM